MESVSFRNGTAVFKNKTRVRHGNQNRNTFKRAGYKFAGWNTKKDGSGKAYKNKQKAKNLAKAGKVKTLYAQWQKVS